MTSNYLTQNSLTLFVRFAPVYFMSTFVLNRISKPENPATTVLFTFALMLISIVFCLYLVHLVMYSFTRNKRLVILIIYSIGFIAFILFMLFVIMPHFSFSSYLGIDDLSKADAIARLILRYINTLVLAGFLYYHISSKYHQEELMKEKDESHKKDLEAQRLFHEKELEAKDMEVAFLSAQINPHFFHNALTAMIEDCDENSQEVAKQLRNLSAVMRYKTDCTKPENSIMPEHLEVKALRAYLEIMKWRFPNVDIQFETAGDEQGQRILPTALIALVENMFKHGVYRQGRNPLVIKRELHTDYVSYQLRNKIDPQSERNASGGVGLMNIKRRLDLLFTDQYQLEIETDQDNYYNVYLKINQ